MHTAEGAEYNLPPNYSMIATEQTSLDNFRYEIYNCVGCTENEYLMKLFARFNTGSNGRNYYSLIPVTNQDVWKIIYDTAAISDSSIKVLEIIVEMIVNVPGANVNPPISRTRRGSRSVGYRSGQSRRMISQQESNPEPQQHEIPEIPEPQPEPEIPVPEPCVDSNNDVQVDQVNDTGLESGDAFDGDWDTDDTGTGDVDRDHVPTRTQHLPISGRSEHHPCRDFNYSEGFVRANSNLYGTPVESTNPLEVGKRFISRDHLRQAINDFHIRANIEVRFKHSDPGRVRVICKDPNCGYKLFARPTGVGSNWEIIKNPMVHTCRSPANRHDHAQLTAAMIADVIEPAIMDDVTTSIKQVSHLVKVQYDMFTPKYNKLWRGRELAIARMFGSWEGSYNLLKPMLESIIRANPGTKCHMLTKNIEEPGKRQFIGVCWAFGPCIDVIPYIRPVISIDACFMSGRYKGRLLIACGYDADNHLLPLAFAIVEKENADNWGYFMKWLRREVIGIDRYMCVISDRHLAIKHVFRQTHLGWNESAGECAHRYCIQHVAENLYKHVGCDKTVANRFKLGARRCKPRRLTEMWEDLEATCPKAVIYLNKVGKRNPNDENEIPKPEKVFAAEDHGGRRWGILTTNGSESLNNVFRKSRRLPVTAIVDDTFYKVNDWFCERRNLVESLIAEGHRWPPLVEAKLAKHIKKGAHMTVVCYGYQQTDQYEVRVRSEKVPLPPNAPVGYTSRAFAYNVEITGDNSVTCTCQKPQFTGIPCSHVMAVCRKRNLVEEVFVNPLYSLAMMRQTWGHHFHPKQNQCEWPTDDGPIIVPDGNLIRTGRRRHNRIPMMMDDMQGRRLGHQARRATSDRNAAGMINCFTI